MAMVPMPVAAQGAGAERGHIALERQRIEREHAALEQACLERFAVTACIDGVRAQRRAALAPLRERELSLDEADRQQRAGQRRAAIASKQAAAAAAVTKPAGQATRVGVPAPVAPMVTPGPSTRRAKASGAAATAAERVRASQRRQQSAQASQERVANRLVLRDGQGKAAQPLPLPASLPASAPGVRPPR